MKFLIYISEYNKGFDMVVGKRIGYRESIIKTILRKILKLSC